MVVSVKRMSLAALLCAVCILCCSACSGRDEDVRQADSIRIAPYVYSEEESRLLDTLRMKNDVGIVEVQAPSSVKKMVVSAYSLDTENAIWQLKREGSLGFDADHPLLTGNVVMYLKSTPDIRFIVNLLGSVEYQTEDIVPEHVSSLNAMWAFLSEEISADSEEELPIGMIGYTGGNSFEAMDLQDFYTPENLSGYDSVYAVTVRFPLF